MTGSFVDQLHLPIFFRISKTGVTFWIENASTNLELNWDNVGRKWRKLRDYKLLGTHN